MTHVNLTPHPIVFRCGTQDTTISPSGIVARVTSTPGVLLDDTGIVPVYAAPQWGAVEGLPDPIPGVVYITSAIVAVHCAGREDVVSPGTGPHDHPVRDDSGRIVAVTRLIRAPRA